MIRLNQSNRDKKDILFPEVNKYCLMDKGYFIIPSNNEIEEYDIVISTCIRASEI